MKILQLIDTLHPGGAERMAINYANRLLHASIESHICVTRYEGNFKNKLDLGVNYHFLKKRNTLDIVALLKLRRIIKDQKIDIVHAHGSSWFFAVLCSFTGLKFKVVWHDHYGQSEFLNERKLQPLKFFSSFFDGIISVNIQLREWAIRKLNCKKVVLLNNFIINEKCTESTFVKLNGEADYNLICVANLRPQKDHYSLLQMFEQLSKKYNIALHIIGKEFEDTYSKDLADAFKKTENCYYYGEQYEISSFLAQADIGILSSNSEGLPLILLEYGKAALPVVCTNVGECAEVLGENAILVDAGKPEMLYDAVAAYLGDAEMRNKNGTDLKKRIKKIYNEKTVIPKYLAFCKAL